MVWDCRQNNLSHWLWGFVWLGDNINLLSGGCRVFLAMSGLHTKGVLRANLNQQVEIVTQLNQNREEKYMQFALINSHHLLSVAEVFQSKHFVKLKQSAFDSYLMAKLP